MLTFLLASHLRPSFDPQPPFVSPMFGDHMVLQRDMRDPVWGWAPAGTKVTVSVAGQMVTATSGADGKWLARLAPVKAGGPYELTIDGPQKVTYSDVLFGDVWVCSGQSNMEFGLGNVKDPAGAAATADLPNVRLYYVPKVISPNPLPFSLSDWKVCTPQSVLSDGSWNGFSAVAFYFGAKLHKDLGVPIGLVHTSWGGTPAEAWTREEELSKFPAYKGRLDQINDFRKAQAAGGGMSFAERLAQWYKKYDAGTQGNWQDPMLDDSDWKTMAVPGYFQRAGIPELVNNQSVVWFRSSIEVPAEDLSGATMTLDADDNDVAWVNGVQVGATDGVNVPRQYKIPDGVLKPGKNSFVFRITDTGQPGGIFGEPYSFALISSGGQLTSLAGTWKVKLGARVDGNNPFPSALNQDPNFPTVLYNGMISPLLPFGIKGAIWYQGESNSGRGYEYRSLLPAMINSWRSSFGEGAFPFLIVQLAGFGHAPAQPGEDGWAELREAQTLTAKNLRNTGMASAVDVGDENDIHPKDKKTVGERLAAVAERMTYGKKVLDSGPTYKSMKVTGSSVELSFDHTDGGLSIQGSGPLFAVAGSDHKWYWADVKIDGNKVIVSSASVPQPVAVRYYWASFLSSNLMNGEGWPAIPFRTDNWSRPGQQ